MTGGTVDTFLEKGQVSGLYRGGPFSWGHPKLAGCCVRETPKINWMMTGGISISGNLHITIVPIHVTIPTILPEFLHGVISGLGWVKEVHQNIGGPPEPLLLALLKMLTGFCVCMYTYIHIHIYICVCVCVFVRVRVCVCACVVYKIYKYLHEL